MRGVVDGPAVTLTGRDLESDWDEYVELRGVDRAQDLLFHNDFDYEYPNNTTQDLDDILDNVFNVQLAGLTNITYTPLVGTPVIGAASFKEGGNFLGSLQELMRRSVYVFYVDDNYELRTGAPGFSGTAFVARSRLGDTTNSIIGDVTLQERDGDKHYNYVKLYGKNPMFDAYTEQNAASWLPGGGLPAILDYAFPKVGSYSLVAYNTNPVSSVLTIKLVCPILNYTSWDFSKGEIGIWAIYDDTAGAPGTPGAGACGADANIECRLVDGGGNIIEYYGDSTKLYLSVWGYCTFPLGEQTHEGVSGVANEWCQLIGTNFDWSDVHELWFTCDRGGMAAAQPSHFYIDGISLPIPPIGIVENAGAQANYRRRPYVDSWSHIRTQNAIQRSAEMILAQSDSTYIDHIKFMVPGSPLLKYAGQTITVDIPSLGMNAELFYTTSIHHIVEPYSDVSGGYGFDWVTEVEAAPTAGIAFDHSRLSRGPLYGSYQRGDRIGVGMGSK
jgi:hypothetical protein